MGSKLSKMSKTVAAGGIQDTQEGLNYQWKSLMLFASRCFSVYKSFILLTEIEAAKNFDDLILHYTDQQGVEKYILAQAKYKKNPVPLDSNLLLTNKNYRLVKYFASFWEISQKFDAQEIENVMIITNNHLAGLADPNSGYLAMKIGQTSESFYFEKISHSIFGNHGEVYRFADVQNPDKKDKVLKIIKIIILSYELASLCDQGTKTNFLSHNQKYLFDAKIIENSKSPTLSEAFCKGKLNGLEFFSQFFNQALNEAGNRKDNFQDKIQRIQKKLKSILNKKVDQDQLTKNQEKADNAIIEFLDKLLYVTKIKTNDLQSEINREFSETFNQINVELVSASVEASLKTWFMGGKQIELTQKDFEDFITKAENQIESMKMIKLKSEAFRDVLEFSSILSKIESFINGLDPTQPRILRLKTPESEVHFAAMRILAKHSVKEEDALMFLTTSFTDDNFKQGLKVFEKLSCYKLMVVELHIDSFNNFIINYESDLENIIQNDPLKKLVLIGDTSLQLVNFQNNQTQINSLQNMITLNEKESYFTALTGDSQNVILDKEIHFQGQETTWRAVLDGHNLSELKIPLKEILKNQLGSEIKICKAYSEKIYIPRTILYNNHLKSSILQRNDQESNDVFHYDKDEFEKQRLSQIPHHLLQRSGNQLEWIESTRDLSIILKHIDESSPKKSSEKELSNPAYCKTVVSDKAGMGKTLLLSKLAEEFKKNLADHWIYKVDLNDHSKVLQKLKENKLHNPDDAIQFLEEKIMKLKTDFEKNHFTRTCTETGKAILLIDGVDEIFSSYGEEVVDMIKLLSQTKIKKLFIATRPECCERLEMEFLQIKHSLKPFSESDQKQYFLEFLKNNDKLGKITEAELRETVEAFMESMKGSISVKDYRHTGVPLVTRLVAEYLICYISDAIDERKSTLNKIVEDLKIQKFSLWSLYENFILKSFVIYFKKKCWMDLGTMRRKEKKILENYKIFAIQQFLNTEIAVEFFPDFSDRTLEIEEMVKVGLIYKTDDGYKFVHQTFTENLFTWHLMENFEQPKIAEFIVRFVLIDPKFQVIQTFVDHWIEEKNTSEIYDIYFNALLSEGSIKHTTPIHVSSMEQNSNIVNFIYDCLTKSPKFVTQKTEVKSYLFRCDEQKAPAIFELIRWSENFNQILDSIKKDFGSEFVLEIFRHDAKFDNKSYNVLLYTSRNGSNLPLLLGWMRSNLTELVFEEQLFSVRAIDQCGILHFAFQFLSNETLRKLLGVINGFEKGLTEKLYLMKNSHNELFHYYYSYNGNSNTESLIEFLKTIKSSMENDDSFLTKIIFHVDEWDQTFLTKFCADLTNFDFLMFLQWFYESFDLTNLQGLLSHRACDEESIIFNYFSNERNLISDCLGVLDYLKSFDFTQNFIKDELILHRNKLEENILQIMFFRSENLEGFDDFSRKFGISDSELKDSLVKSKTAFFYLAQKPEYLDYMQRIFGVNISQELYSVESLCNIAFQSGRFDDFSGSVLKFFDFIQENYVNNTLKLQEIVAFQDGNDRTFLYYLFIVIDKCLIKILNSLFEKLPNQEDFLSDFLSSVDDRENTFLNSIFLQKDAPKMIKISKEFFETIKNNISVEFLKKFLLIKNNGNRNFLHTLLLNDFGGVGKTLEILEILLEVIGDDQKIFIELTGQGKIPDQIKEFLKKNFGK